VVKLRRSDYDQAARYLQHACDLLERDAKAQTRVLRDVLDLAIRRLSPGDDFVGDAAAEITVLSQVAEPCTNRGCAHGNPQGSGGAAG
jgi:hypothetical protein